MAVISWDEYDASGTPTEYWDWDPRPEPYTSFNIQYSMTCPHCFVWINNYLGFQYCPYCGKSLFLPLDTKTRLLQKLDEMLEEIKAIKKELACSP